MNAILTIDDPAFNAAYVRSMFRAAWTGVSPLPPHEHADTIYAALRPIAKATVAAVTHAAAYTRTLLPPGVTVNLVFRMQICELMCDGRAYPDNPVAVLDAAARSDAAFERVFPLGEGEGAVFFGLRAAMFGAMAGLLRHQMCDCIRAHVEAREPLCDQCKDSSARVRDSVHRWGFMRGVTPNMALDDYVDMYTAMWASRIGNYTVEHAPDSNFRPSTVRRLLVNLGLVSTGARDVFVVTPLEPTLCVTYWQYVRAMNYVLSGAWKKDDDSQWRRYVAFLRKDGRPRSVAHPAPSTHCVVCHDTPPEVVFAPCNHTVVCSDCTDLLQGALINGRQCLSCPVCRARITQIDTWADAEVVSSCVDIQ